ncbi:MAG: lipopolysaccharide assembly protein LapA domain-containing protein [Rugosibacter sp.]|nr:lipopolysaccharide assembly protein LapA domain-containing protein [Rugosibacter sp.]
MTTLFKLFLWLLRAAVFVILFGLTLKNSEPMELRFFFNHLWTAPVAIVILVVFVIGVVVGLTAASGIFKHPRRSKIS